jgi:hypothetical protein
LTKASAMLRLILSVRLDWAAARWRFATASAGRSLPLPRTLNAKTAPANAGAVFVLEIRLA